MDGAARCLSCILHDWQPELSEVIDRVGPFDSKFAISEDMDWFARAKHAGVQGDMLDDVCARYRLHGRFYYLAPHEGFTIGHYLLARDLGGAPLQAGYTLTSGPVEPGSLHPGEVVVATLGPGRGHACAHLLTSIRRIEHAGLAVSSVQRLASAHAHRSA